MENNVLEISEFLKRDQIKINEKFIIFHDHVPENYEAFIYKITLEFLGDGLPPWGKKKYYIGWHKGLLQDVITQKYLTSSKSLDEIIPRDDVKIHYDIFAFGTEEDMASLEVRELNKVKAIKNPEFFNKNAGGGLYVVPSKNNKKTNKTKNHIKKMLDNVRLNNYSISFYDRKLLVKLKRTQVRVESIIIDHIKEMIDRLTQISDPKEFDPICVLLSEDGDKEKSIIIGGNHSADALKSVKTLSGLYAIEVPYVDWKLLSESELQSFGMALNPQPKKINMPTSVVDAANWVINTIKEKNLYKVNKKTGEREPDFTNQEITDYMTDILGFTGHVKRGEVTKKARGLWQQDIHLKLGVNFLDFSDESLENDKKLEKWYKNQKKSKEAYKYEIIKASAGDSLFKRIFRHLCIFDEQTDEPIGFHEKVFVFIYFPRLDIVNSDAWKHQYKEFEFLCKNFLNMHKGFEISWQILPHLSSEIILDS
jgi:hypothetical protein